MLKQYQCLYIHITIRCLTKMEKLSEAYLYYWPQLKTLDKIQKTTTWGLGFNKKHADFKGRWKAGVLTGKG